MAFSIRTMLRQVKRRLDRRSRWAEAFSLVLFVALISALLVFLFELSVYKNILRLDVYQPTSHDENVLIGMLWAKSISLQLTTVMLGTILVFLGFVRPAHWVAIILSTAVLLFVIFDFQVYDTFGWHLTFVFHYLGLPEGHVVGGSKAKWALLVGMWCVLVTAGNLSVLYGTRFLCHRIDGLVSRGMKRFVLATSLILLLATGAAPFVSGPMWSDAQLRERFFAATPFNFPRIFGAPREIVFDDPVLNTLQEEMSDIYRNSYAKLFHPSEIDRSTRLPIGAKKNVHLIMIESFRHLAFNDRYTPRLFEWAKQGYWLTNHYTGSICSEASLFALLYSRSPLAFHQTLNSRIRPQLFETLRASGYEIAFFTGHPRIWNRREEFVNESTVDHYVHNNKGDWPDWDRHALRGMVELAKNARSPVFSLVLLMSSHFEYRYPKAYEKYTPVSVHIMWGTSGSPEPTAEFRDHLLNRYHNSLAFLDDLIMNEIEKVDPQENIFIITGDHGESFLDDGHFTHASILSDIVAKVPMILVGPGISPGRRTDFTMHADIAPTLLHVLGGNEISLARAHGRNLFYEQPRRSEMLLSFPTLDRRINKCLLIWGGLRLGFEAHYERPWLQITGFEDDKGSPVADPDVDVETARQLVEAFRREIDIAVHR